MGLIHFWFEWCTEIQNAFCDVINISTLNYAVEHVEYTPRRNLYLCGNS